MGASIAGRRHWVEAARPRTLVAGAVPVVVGTAAAGRFIAWRFVAALVVAVALQVAVNYANDLFDALRGVDTRDRIGPRRAVASGLISPSRMKLGVGIALGVAALAGTALALAAGPWLLIVGAACAGAALAYSGGPRPYASAGLGEVFVFVFFGLVATVGSAYVQTETISSVGVAAAVPVGLLAVAILVVNNLRDVRTDARTGKRTLAVRWGAARTRTFLALLVAGAFIGVLFVALVVRSPGPLIALFAAPGARAPLSLARSNKESDMLRALGATARLELVTGVLLAGGLLLAR